MTSDPIARYLAGHGARLGRRERLRVMNSSDVLGVAMRVYRQLGWTFLRLTVVPSIFCLGGIAFVLNYVIPSLFYTHQGNNFNGQMVEAGTSIVLALVIGGPLFLLGLAYSSAVIIHLTSDYMLGNPIRPDEAVRSATKSVPALLRVAVRQMFLSLSGVFVSLALMGVGGILSQHTADDSPISGLLFIVGAFGLIAGFGIFIYVMLTHALAPAVTVLEGAKGREAGKRSTWLQKNIWGHPPGTATLVSALLLMAFAGAIEWAGFAALFAVFDIPRHVAELVGGTGYGGLIEGAFGLVPPFLVVWTVLPLWAVCATIVYYERRIRLEGYDIEALAQEIDRNRSSRFDV